VTFLSKYGVARHIYIPIIKRGVVDYAVSGDWTPASGDVKISKDGGAAANVTNLPSAITMGNTAMWDFSLTATEMQAAQVMVSVADSATKAVEDQFFIIETHGNASALFQVDLADGVRAGLTALPNAAAGANGGLPTGNASGQVAVASHATGAITSTAFASGAITAASIATDAIGAAELAADAATEIATAVWATATRSLTILDEDSTTLDLDATIRSAVGLASANLDTQIGTLATAANLATVAGYIDTEIATIITNIDALPTNAELATALGTADDAVLAQIALVKAQTDLIPSDPADASVIAARFDTLDTSIADLPTNAELATALAGADDAILAVLGTPVVTIAADIAGISAGSGPTASEIADEVETRTLDANIVKVNNVTVSGTGAPGSEWGP
jgi:hypothetical protein